MQTAPNCIIEQQCKKPPSKHKNCLPETLSYALRKIVLHAQLKLLNCLKAPFNQSSLKTNHLSILAQGLSMNLHAFVNGGQLSPKPVPKKQQRKQPKTKTVDIDTQWQKTIDTTQKLTAQNHLTAF
jgi:hypothetical protein